jgi:hypothetical protein
MLNEFYRIAFRKKIYATFRRSRTICSVEDAWRSRLPDHATAAAATAVAPVCPEAKTLVERLSAD